MCQIRDIVYHYCAFCGNVLDRVGYCPDEAFAGLCGDLCLHIKNRVVEEESFDMFCPTCFYISELRKQYQAGKLTAEELEKIISDISRGLVEAPATPMPGEDDLEIPGGVKRVRGDDKDDIMAAEKLMT